MAGILDQSGFDFCGTTIQSLRELTFDEVITNPLFSSIHTVFPGIVAKTQMGFIGEGGLVGVKNQGCSPDPQDWSLGTREVTFDPTAWEVLIRECWANLEATAAAYALRRGGDRSDFTETDYAAIVEQALSRALLKFQWRTVWFGDTEAANLPGGEITAGVDVKYFNLIDGLFKQLEAQSALNAKQRVAIAENAGATYAAQEVTSDAAVAYLRSVVRSAPVVLKSQSNKMLLVTGGIYEAYKESLQSACCTETTYRNLTEGMGVLKFDGIPLIPVYGWDEVISAYMNDGAKLVNPHRIVFTTPDVLGVAVDADGEFDVSNVWYDRASREVALETMGMIDAKLMNPDLFVYAV